MKASIKSIVAKANDKLSYVDKTIMMANTAIKLDKLLKITLFTTDKGPVFDDMALFLVQSDNLIVVPSEHPDFMDTITQLNKDFPINYQKVIEAQSGSRNQEFVLWKSTV
jgi:hypothetical protein